MKRLIVFISIFLTLSMGLIAFFVVKPNAITQYDGQKISFQHEFVIERKYSQVGGGHSYFQFSITDYTDFLDLPFTFETLDRYGRFHLFFNFGGDINSFSGNKENYSLTISNGGNVIDNYFADSLAIDVLPDGVYHLGLSFKEILLKDIDILSNDWVFYITFLGNFSLGDYIDIVPYIPNPKGYTNSFEFFYYGDLTNQEYYDNGYNDGYRDGNNDGYSDGYRDGNSDGYVDGYKDGELYGRSIGYDNGYQKGLLDGSQMEVDYSFLGLLNQVFIGLGSLLAINLLPGIPIGAIIAVPIVFGIIYFIIGKRGGSGD